MLSRTIFTMFILSVAVDLADTENIMLHAQSTSPLQQQDTSSPDTETSNLSNEILESTPEVEWRISFAKILWTIIIFLVAFISIRYVSKLLETIGERWTNLRLLIKGLVPIIRIGAWTFVIYFIIAAIISPPIETLIAVTASAGIAVGFASQDILKNIFGGIMILFDRPFQVGDKIQVGSHYGEVIQIGLRTVRMNTPDDSMVSIPNSEIVNQSVSNSNSGQFNCQVVSEYYLPGHINLTRLKKICYYSAAVSKYAYLKKPITIIIKNEVHQGRSILKVRLKAYVLDLRYECVFSSELTERVIEQLLKEKLIQANELSFLPSQN